MIEEQILKTNAESWENRFDLEFPLFGVDDDYCCPNIETKLWEGDIAQGDDEIREKIKSFIRKELIKNL